MRNTIDLKNVLRFSAAFGLVLVTACATVPSTWHEGMTADDHEAQALADDRHADAEMKKFDPNERAIAGIGEAYRIDGAVEPPHEYNPTIEHLEKAEALRKDAAAHRKAAQVLIQQANAASAQPAQCSNQC
jgi:hypothetical protein